MDSAVREMERRASPELRRAQTAREPALTFQGLGPAREPSKPLPDATYVVSHICNSVCVHVGAYDGLYLVIAFVNQATA